MVNTLLDNEVKRHFHFPRICRPVFNKYTCDENNIIIKASNIIYIYIFHSQNSVCIEIWRLDRSLLLETRKKSMTYDE